MKTIWTDGIKEDKRKVEIKQDYIGGAGLRLRLAEILEKKIESKRISTLSATNYESPSWALFQADAIGYERAINEIISLISEKSV